MTRVVVGVITITLAACIPYGDAWLNIRGRVTDPRGVPIEGAAVQIFAGDSPARDRVTVTTNAAGEYEVFEGSCPCDFAVELRVTKPGYQPYTLNLRGRRANSLRRHDVTLWPE